MNERPVLGQICWNELATPNLKAAKDFYEKVFGWQFVDHDMGDMKYTMVRINDKDLSGIWSIPKERENEIPPHWMAYILVENIEQALKKPKNKEQPS